MNKRRLLISACFCLLVLSFQKPTDLKTKILNRLSEYTSEKYPEKIYVHTDKPYYIAGEDIWFNTFLVNGVTHKRSAKSRVIYVELINDKDSVISERKLFTEDVNAEGDFKLPVDIKDGVYKIRAYTNYMRNQSREFFFKKNIPVYAMYSEAVAVKQDSISSDNLELPEIGFYPEGGYLISGLKNKVAIKIKDADIDAKEILGIIEDENGNKITEFKTQEFGLGSFEFTPKAGKSYQAVIRSGEKDVLYPLPVTLATGYVINTSFSEKEVRLNIATNKNEGLKNLVVIGHQRGMASFDYLHENNNDNLLLKIPKDDLTEGILNIVLFDEFQNPVAERLVYIEKENKIELSIDKTNSANATTRDKVQLEIAVKDEFGELIPSTLSLSVIDAELIPQNSNAENIRSWLLLNSDLRGKIKWPNYFFTSGNLEKKNALLDLVMMTHGWRRFVWQEILESSPLIRFEPEDGIYIHGHTIDSKSPYQHKVTETKLTFRHKGFYQETQKGDENAYFSYGPFDYKDSIDVFLSVNTERPSESETNIILKSPLERPSIAPDEQAQSFKWPIPSVETYRQKSRATVMSNFQFDDDRERLEEVVVTKKVKSKEEIRDIERVKRARANNPSHRVLVSAMGEQGSGNFMTLISNIPGVRIELVDDEEVSGHYVISLHGRVPDFYLDNVKVDINDALSVNQVGIDFIDVIRAGGAASTQYALSGAGVIAIYTKRGSREFNMVDYSKKIGSISFNSKGFYAAREFYSPDYSSAQEVAKREDSRSTLYWNPKVNTRYYQSARVSFYTSDDKGKFRVEVEGITDDGVPIYGTAIFEVD